MPRRGLRPFLPASNHPDHIPGTILALAPSSGNGTREARQIANVVFKARLPCSDHYHFRRFDFHALPPQIEGWLRLFCLTTVRLSTRVPIAGRKLPPQHVRSNASRRRCKAAMISLQPCVHFCSQFTPFLTRRVSCPRRHVPCERLPLSRRFFVSQSRRSQKTPPPQSSRRPGRSILACIAARWTLRSPRSTARRSISPTTKARSS